MGKLGRKPLNGELVLSLEELVRRKHVVLTPAPADVEFLELLGNDTFGDSVAASFFYMFQRREPLEVTVPLTSEQALGFYEAVTGYRPYDGLDEQ